MMPIHPTLRIACALLLLTGGLDAQAQTWGASSTQEREAVQVDRDAMMAQSWTSGLELHNIGPAVMGGRVVDLSVVGDTTYVAYATGGLWKTTNHGTTFEPLLEATTMLGAATGAARGPTPDSQGRITLGACASTPTALTACGSRLWASCTRRTKEAAFTERKMAATLGRAS